MTLVVDSSAVLSWHLREDPAEVAAIREALLGTFLVPPLWATEVANGLVMAERRGRITAAARDEIGRAVEALDAQPVAGPGIARIAQIAARTGLTAYDAEYLHLAADRGASLLTLDRRLASCAVSEGVPLAAGSVVP